MSDLGDITFQYVVPKRRYKRACLIEMHASPFWRKLLLSCWMMGCINTVMMFVLLAMYCDWKWVSIGMEGPARRDEPGWIIAYGCLNLAVFLLAPFVLARIKVAADHKAISRCPPLRVTLTQEGYRIDFGGSHSFYSWPKVVEIIETTDGFIFRSDECSTNSFEKSQLTDDIVQRIHDLMKTVNVPLQRR